MRLFLAMIPNNECVESIEYARPTSVLMSYYYLRKKNDAWKKQFFERMRAIDVMVFIDSGAFTFIFQKNGPLKKFRSLKESYKFFEKYSIEYAEFLKKWWDWFDVYAEVDVDAVIGYKNVLKLRGIFLPGLHEKFVPVHHPATRPFKDWERDVDKFNFLAIGSSDFKDETLPYFNKMLKYAHNKGKGVHGFALINQKILKTLPFYSADSSSWMSANRFGVVKIFDKKGGTLKEFHYRDKEKVRMYFVQLLKVCPEFFKLYEDKTGDKRTSRVFKAALNAKAYVALEKYLTKIWTTKGITWPDKIN